MLKLLRSITKDTSGASAAEYALIVAIIGGFVVAAVTAFGGSMQDAFTHQGTALTTALPATSPSRSKRHMEPGRCPGSILLQ